MSSDAVLLLDAAGPPAGGGAGAGVQLAAPLLLHSQCHHHHEPRGQVPVLTSTMTRALFSFISIYLLYGQADDGSTRVCHTSPH